MYRAESIVRNSYPTAPAEASFGDYRDLISREGFVVLTGTDPVMCVCEPPGNTPLDSPLNMLASPLTEINSETPIEHVLVEMYRSSRQVLGVRAEGSFQGVVTTRDVADAVATMREALEQRPKQREKLAVNRQLRTEIVAHRRTIGMLCDAEDRFRAIFESAPAVICIHDSYKSHYMNPYARALMECDHRIRIQELIHPTERVRVRQTLRQIKSTRKFAQLSKLRIQGRKGTEHILQTTTGLIWIGNNERFLTMAFDITDKAALEQEIKDHRVQFENLVENLSEGIWCVDETGRTKYANRALCEFKGLELKNMLGKPVTAFVKGRNITAVEELLRAVKAGARVRQTFTTRDCKGRKRWIHVSAVPDLGSDQNYRGALIAADDITDVLATQEALERSRRHFVELADSISEVFFALDDRFRITYWGSGASAELGISSEMALGKRIEHVFPMVVDHGRMKRIYDDVTGTGRARRTNLRFKDSLYELTIYPFGRGISVIVRNRSAQRILTNAQLDSSHQELKAIGQSIHNGLGQYLAALSMRCGELQMKAQQSLPISALDIEAVHRLAIEANEDVHDLAHSLLLRSGEISSDVKTIDAICKRIESNFKVVVKTHCQGKRLLPHNRFDRTHAVRFVEEALTNAAKHSGCKRVDLAISEEKDGTRYEIVDKGVGPMCRRATEGIGLQLMQFNADELGGEFEILQGKNGTTVRLRVPHINKGE